jgi:hypothetical protein
MRRRFKERSGATEFFLADRAGYLLRSLDSDSHAVEALGLTG